jgi:hypothetical protein
LLKKAVFVFEGRFEFASIVRRLIYGLGGVGVLVLAFAAPVSTMMRAFW